MRTCFIIGLLFLLTAGIATAQTSSLPPRFEITAYGGGAWYDMETFNNYMAYADLLGLPSSPLYGGPNVGGEIDYFLNDRISVGIGADYAWEDGAATFWTPIGTQLTRVAADMQISFIAPRVHVKVHNLSGPWDYYLGVGVAYILGTADLRIDTANGTMADLELEENGIGGFTMAGASYQFAPPFSIGAQAGFRYYNAGDLDDGELNVIYRSIGLHERLGLDFTGAFVQASIGMRF